MSIKLSTYKSAVVDETSICATFQNNHLLADEFAMQILREIARAVAEQYVKEHYPELIAKLDQQAIANLVIAESGKKIAEEIRTRPVILREPGKKVYNNFWSIL